jgi:hypothetical protein
MTIADQIRDYLRAQRKPVKVIEIRKATGLDRQKLNSRLRDMVAAGHVIRIGTHKPSRYRLGAAPRKVYRYPTEEARLAARRAVRQRSRPREERRRRQRADVIARAAQRAAERIARQEAARAQRLAAQEARQAARQAELAKVAANATRTVPTPADARPAETVEQFLARGGRIERLPIDAPWSDGKLKGHAAANAADWHVRKSA